jgi:hypothetical protein
LLLYLTCAAANNRQKAQCVECVEGDGAVGNGGGVAVWLAAGQGLGGNKSVVVLLVAEGVVLSGWLKGCCGGRGCVATKQSYCRT